MAEAVRVRFAPSPTGYLHVGGARTALYNWLLARCQGGAFILRIEDTDPERSTEESAGAILESLRWLGLDWDELYRQAERLPLYQEHAERLIKEGKAYYCVCRPEELEERRKGALAAGLPPRYDGRCRGRTVKDQPAAVRFLMPEEGLTVVEDLIHGEIVFEDREMDDFILLRSDGTPTYNFAVVVDDHLMAITHVIRGNDHLSNTPKQLKLYLAFGFPIPKFAHLPMILGPDRTRLSKRHGATSIQAYRNMGYLPEALVNYLARLGWSHGDQEIFTREDLLHSFSLAKVGKTPAVFDPSKLLWLNGYYLRKREPKQLVEPLQPFWEEVGVGGEELKERDERWLEQVVMLFKERAKTLEELALSSRVCFAVPVDVDPEARAQHLQPKELKLLEELRPNLSALTDFQTSSIGIFLRAFAAGKGLKLVVVAQPIRVALTGRTVSPPLFEIMALLGKPLCLKRLNAILGE